MAELREAAELATGELLDGRYRLDERIGEGATAQVFRAEDTILGRTVAVKILRAPVDGLSQIERALSETSLLASLNHHALVTLFDAHVSETDGSYLVMEYVEGITLRERIAAGPVDPGELASLTVDIAEGLHIAHSAGIVHRDIKPSNVLLWKSPIPGREWRAKIADFGIAHLLDSNRVTTPGLIVGTAAYIAPEQAGGAEPAPSADIYSLGLLLLEALTCTRPFGDAEGIGTVVARLSKAPTIPNWLEEGWQQLLRGMTSIAPADRPTALEVIVAASHLLPPADPADTDHPTVAMAAADTGTTAILPLAAAVAGGAVASRAAEAPTAAESPPSPAVIERGLPSTATVVAASEATNASVPPGRVHRWRPLRDRRRRRRSLVLLAALAALALASAVGAALWLASPLASPDPLPSTPAEEQILDSPVDESPTVESPAPVGDTVDEPAGNSNSGPGSNNGNDKNKDSEKDKGKGNGKGNGG